MREIILLVLLLAVTPSFGDTNECRSHRQCKDSFCVRVPAGTWRCLGVHQNCRYQSDCPANLRCSHSAKKCTAKLKHYFTGCEADSDCTSGLHCRKTGNGNRKRCFRAGEECSKAYDCKDNEICPMSLRRCIPRNGSEESSPSRIQQGSKSWGLVCSSSAECGTGLSCRNPANGVGQGRCLTGIQECKYNIDCPRDKRCSRGGDYRCYPKLAHLSSGCLYSSDCETRTGKYKLQCRRVPDATNVNRKRCLRVGEQCKIDMDCGDFHYCHPKTRRCLLKGRNTASGWGKVCDPQAKNCPSGLQCLDTQRKGTSRCLHGGQNCMSTETDCVSTHRCSTVSRRCVRRLHGGSPGCQHTNDCRMPFQCRRTRNGKLRRCLLPGQECTNILDCKSEDDAAATRWACDPTVKQCYTLKAKKTAYSAAQTKAAAAQFGLPYFGENDRKSNAPTDLNTLRRKVQANVLLIAQLRNRLRRCKQGRPVPEKDVLFKKFAHSKIIPDKTIALLRKNAQDAANARAAKLLAFKHKQDRSRKWYLSKGEKSVLSGVDDTAVDALRAGTKDLPRGSSVEVPETIRINWPTDRRSKLQRADREG